MTPAHHKTLVEICYDQIARIHSDLCRDRKFDQAEKSRAVMKGLIDLSYALEEKEED